MVYIFLVCSISSKQLVLDAMGNTENFFLFFPAHHILHIFKAKKFPNFDSQDKTFTPVSQKKFIDIPFTQERKLIC